MMTKIYVSTASALASGGEVTLEVVNEEGAVCRVVRVECEALVTDAGAPGGYREEGKQYITGRLDVIQSATTNSYPSGTARPLTLWGDGHEVVSSKPIDIPKEGARLYLKSLHPSGAVSVHVVLHVQRLDPIRRQMQLAG